MKLSRSSIMTIGLTLIVGVAIGAIFFGGSTPPESTVDTHDHELSATGTWTCSMHPQVRQSEAGSCPFCGMDLIPVEDSSDENPRVLKMSQQAIQLANIQTAIVRRTGVDDVLRLNGKVQVDERRINIQTTHFGGRVEELYKSFEGDVVRKGEKVASIYSPELVAAQEELIEAKKLEKTNPVLLEAAKRKLHHWKLTMDQISEIETSKEPMRNFDLLADYEGIITKKMVNTGNHLHEGGALMEISDFSKVWAVFEVYEKDLSRINIGDRFDFENQATGKSHLGTISFIAPEVDQQTRIVEVRADIGNTSGSLKPGMFISTAIFTSQEGGLFVPKSAVLWTGKRSVVYVKDPNQQSFQLREVVIGDGFDDQYLVKEGLQEGDEIVEKGAFTLDAEAQLKGKFSMMNPAPTQTDNGVVKTFVEVDLPGSIDYSTEVNSNFKEGLTALANQYLLLKDLMVEGNGTNIRKAAIKVKLALEAVRPDMTKEESYLHWTTLSGTMMESLNVMTTTGDRDLQRLHFINQSKALINAVQSFGTSFENPLYIQFCPMANDNAGATWISLEENIVNPYFGDVMLTCGNVESVIEGK